MPVTSAGRGALIGRLGSDDAGQPFLIGASIQFPVRVTGRLFLGINGPSGDSANGSFHVKIEISGNASVSSPATTPSSNPPVPSGTSTGGSTLADSPAGTTSSNSSTSPSTSPGGSASSSSQ